MKSNLKQDNEQENKSVSSNYITEKVDLPCNAITSQLFSENKKDSDDYLEDFNQSEIQL